MKIQCISDLHLEFLPDLGREFITNLPVTGDILVIAGDFIPIEGNFKLAKSYIEMVAKKYQHIIWLWGNHELYGGETTQTVAEGYQLHREGPKNTSVFATGGLVTIEGQRFVCSTLWFSRNRATNKNERGLNDFFQIKNFKPWVYNRNQSDVDFLRKEVTQDDVIITHHLPSYKSVHPRFAGDSFNCFFVCDLEDLIIERQPKVWLHGHTHDNMDYSINKTRIICNPHGYNNENPSFNVGLTIEI